MNRRNTILLALLIVQLILIGWVYRPGLEQAPPVRAFFPGLTAADVQGLAITDEAGGLIRLGREEERWTILEVRAAGEGRESLHPVAPPLPADSKKVEALVKRLTGLESSRLVTRTRGSQARLKVADAGFVRKIELSLGNGSSRVLFLGSSPSFKDIHARAAGEDEVYLVKGMTSWEAATDQASWWQTAYVDFAPEQLREMELTNANGSFRLQRAADGQWELAGAGEEALSPQAVEDFLQRMSFLSVSDYLGREQGKELAAFGLAKPSARLELGLEGERSISLRVGPEEKEGGERVVKSSASPFYVKVSEYALQPLLEQKAEDLLRKEGQEDGDVETPAPGQG